MCSLKYSIFKTELLTFPVKFTPFTSSQSEWNSSYSSSCLGKKNLGSFLTCFFLMYPLQKQMLLTLSSKYFWNLNICYHFYCFHSGGQYLLLSQFRSEQSLSRVWLFVTPWIAREASLPITNSRSSLKLTSIQLVMPSSHLILCRSLLLLPPDKQTPSLENYWSCCPIEGVLGTGTLKPK